MSPLPTSGSTFFFKDHLVDILEKLEPAPWDKWNEKQRNYLQLLSKNAKLQPQIEWLEDVPDDLKHVVTSLLQFHPSDRLSAANCLKSNIFDSIRNTVNERASKQKVEPGRSELTRTLQKVSDRVPLSQTAETDPVNEV